MEAETNQSWYIFQNAVPAYFSSQKHIHFKLAEKYSKYAWKSVFITSTLYHNTQNLYLDFSVFVVYCSISIHCYTLPSNVRLWYCYILMILFWILTLVSNPIACLQSHELRWPRAQPGVTGTATSHGSAVALTAWWLLMTATSATVEVQSHVLYCHGNTQYMCYSRVGYQCVNVGTCV